MSPTSPNRYPASRVAALGVSLFAMLIAVSTLSDHGPGAFAQDAPARPGGQPDGDRFVDRFATAVQGEAQSYSN